MECAVAEIISFNEWWLRRKAAGAVREAPRFDYCKVIDAGSVERLRMQHRARIARPTLATSPATQDHNIDPACLR